MRDWLTDVFQGGRSLRRSPGFTVSAAMSLALGIAATAVLFSILDGAYIHLGQTDRANRAVVLVQRFTEAKRGSWAFSGPEYLSIAQLHGAFEDFLATRASSATLSDAGESGNRPERVPLVRTTANIFKFYGVSTILGRGFTPAEDQPGGANVAIITWRLWNRRFARNPAIVGEIIRLDGKVYTVIGVAPRRFQQWGADIYVPLQLDLAAGDRSDRTLSVAGMPRRGATLEQAKTELQYLAKRVENEYRGANPEYGGLKYVPYDIRTLVVGDLRRALYVLLAASGLLLIVAAANLISLFLARAISRATEIGVRMALGSTTFRVFRQFFLEGLILGSVAGLTGVVIGLLAFKPIMALIPSIYIGEETEIRVSIAAFLFAIAIALFFGASSGLVSAMFIVRRGVGESMLVGRSRSFTDRRSGRLRFLLVSAEMSLAFVVLVSAALMVRSYERLTSMDFGFRTDHVLTMRVALPEDKYQIYPQIAGFFDAVLLRLQGLPGIVDAAISSSRPMLQDGLTRVDLDIPGLSINTSHNNSIASRIISPDYFTTIGTPLIQGRFFSEYDGRASSPVAIVNESFAHTWFPNKALIGLRIRLREPRAAKSNFDQSAGLVVQIVGVVKNARQVVSGHLQDLDYAPLPEVYLPFSQQASPPSDMAILLRTSTEPTSQTEPVRKQVLNIDSDLPLYGVQTLQEIADTALGPARLALVLLGIFAFTALLTASFGLYAVVSHAVSQRTQEVGIRLAMGARREDIFFLIMRQAVSWIGGGLAFGLFASFSLTRVMSSVLFGVHRDTPATIVAVSVLLTAVALLACYIPGRRAALADPLVALRSE